MLAAKGGKNFIGCGFQKKGKEEFVFCLCQTVIKQLMELLIERSFSPSCWILLRCVHTPAGIHPRLVFWGPRCRDERSAPLTQCMLSSYHYTSLQSLNIDTVNPLIAVSIALLKMTNKGGKKRERDLKQKRTEESIREKPWWNFLCHTCN